MGLIRGEDRCINCGYKLSSKLRHQLANQSSTSENANSSSNKAVRDFEESGRKLELAEQKAHRKKLSTYVVLLSSGVFLLWGLSIIFSIAFRS